MSVTCCAVACLGVPCRDGARPSFTPPATSPASCLLSTASSRHQVACFSKLSHDFITRRVKGVPREAALPDPARGRALRPVRWAAGQEGVCFARPGCRSALVSCRAVGAWGQGGAEKGGGFFGSAGALGLGCLGCGCGECLPDEASCRGRGAMRDASAWAGLARDVAACASVFTWRLPCVGTGVKYRFALLAFTIP